MGPWPPGLVEVPMTWMTGASWTFLIAVMLLTFVIVVAVVVVMVEAGAGTVAVTSEAMATAGRYVIVAVIDR